MPSTRHLLELVKGRYGPAALLAFLVTCLLWNIGTPFWDDEAATMNLYILGGWDGVMAGDYGVNNHRLYSLLSLGTSELFGTTEAVVRIWSILPAVLAAVIFHLWLARRFGRGWALVGTGLLVVNFQFMTLAPQARGYGLVFLGWCLVTVFGLDYLEDRRHRDLLVASTGGLVGILTFPLVAIPMTVSYLILWVTRRRDLRPLVHLGACGIISIVWYRDAFDVLTNSREGFANHALIVAIGPSDTYDWLFYAGDLIPLEESLGQIVALGAILALAAAAITAAFRSRRFAPTAFLFAPATITLALAWAGDVALWDRYASFFVFSALVLTVMGARFLHSEARAWPVLAVSLLATSAVSVRHFLPESLGAIASAAAGVAIVVAATVAVVVVARLGALPVRSLVTACAAMAVFGAAAWGVLDLARSRSDIPYQDFRSVQELVAGSSTDELVVSYPLESLDYYLGRDYTQLNRVERPLVLPITSIEDQLETVCESTETAIVLFNHYDPTDMLDDECLRKRTDAELHLVPMVRGLSVSVWLVG